MIKFPSGSFIVISLAFHGCSSNWLTINFCEMFCDFSSISFTKIFKYIEFPTSKSFEKLALSLDISLVSNDSLALY